jgi:Flp pilus assembly protein TadG
LSCVHRSIWESLMLPLIMKRCARQCGNTDTRSGPKCRLNPLSRFTQNDEGSIAILFGLMSIALFMMIGLAVDYGRWLTARNQTIAAADAAVLAGVRALQTNGGNQTAALILAQTYYAQAVTNRLKTTSDSINFAITDNGTAIVTTGNATIATPFMGLAGVKSLPLYHSSGADYSKAVLAVGGNGQTNVETSLILDISGSMAGSKVADLKTAATNLINIIVWSDQSQYTSKVALVPYSLAVNAGTYAQTARGSVTSGTCTTPGCQYYQFKNPSNQNVTFGISNCVSERTGTNAYTDVAPSVALVGRNYASPNNPCLSNTVIPLSSDTTMLTTKINALQATGSTGGQVGVAWGWYTLSPNWTSVWPSASRPAPYGDLTALNSMGKPKLKKIAVLMTDGEYNSPYCNGVIAQDATSGSGSTSDHINCNATNGSSYSQALTTCTNMKAAGIELYTVGFLVVDSQPARDLLSQCATDASHYYVSTDGNALQSAFQDIALKIASIYLAN